MVDPQGLLVVFSALLGLVVGSFGNVVIHRVPRRESLAFPASHCPACSAPIPWYLNIPLLSWLLLLGKCRACRAPISMRYPAVELACGLLFTLSALWWGFSWATPIAMLFCALALFLSVIDLEHQILPDVLTLPGLTLGLAFCWAMPWTTWKASLLGALLGAGLPWALLLFWEKILKRDGMGFGDVKLMGMVGAFLGWQGALLTLLLGSVLGMLLGGAWLLARRKQAQTPLPFGTFLGGAAIVALFFGDRIWGWYLGLFPGGGKL